MGLSPEDIEHARAVAREHAKKYPPSDEQLRKVRAALFPSNVRPKPKLYACDNCGKASDVSPDGGLCVSCENDL